MSNPVTLPAATVAVAIAVCGTTSVDPWIWLTSVTIATPDHKPLKSPAKAVTGTVRLVWLSESVTRSRLPKSWPVVPPIATRSTRNTSSVEAPAASVTL